MYKYVFKQELGTGYCSLFLCVYEVAVDTSIQFIFIEFYFLTLFKLCVKTLVLYHRESYSYNSEK
jgi:hypothetical protein